MARTRRNPHELHAEAAMQAKQAAAGDGARTLHDHAWQAHSTAASHHAHAERNAAAAAQMRQMAGFAESRRRLAEATECSRLAAEYDRAAVFCRERAEHHHQRGIALTASAHQADSQPAGAAEVAAAEPEPAMHYMTEEQS